MGTTRDYCRYTKVLLTPYQGAITIRGIDLSNMLVSGSTRPLRDSGCLFMVQAFWEANVVLGSDLRLYRVPCRKLC